MRNIHIAHKKIGGVADILSRLELLGDKVIYIDNVLDFCNLDLDCYNKIFFHQPKAHLYLFKLLLLRKVACKKCTIVLHESSNYTFNYLNPISYIYTIIRFMLVNLLSFKIDCVAVSKFISSTFCRRFETISFCYLYKDEVEKLNFRQMDKNNTVVIWIRKGDFQINKQLLSNSSKVLKDFHFVVLGDEYEVSKMKFWLKGNGYNTLDLEHKIAFVSFIQMLIKSKIFISLFPREGFGLATFFAAYFGNLIVHSDTGAVSEWIPSMNMKVWTSINDSNFEKFDFILNKVAEVNKSKCIHIMRNN